MTARAAARPRATPEDEPAVNEVRLVGRVSGDPVSRDLPSGDTVVQLRVVVRRTGTPRTGARTATLVDTVDVACWGKGVQRRASHLRDGDIVEVTGALRRRFWRSPGGAASRYEVEAATLTRQQRSTGP
ncbi:MAG: single-stranded DNA-binding protein [Oryzihumus sp.]